MRVPRRSDADTSASMTPLIDVVFLLIIFFLVSSHLSRRETLFPVDLPAAEASLLSDVSTQRLTLTIDAEGIVRARGRVVGLPDIGAIIRETMVEDQQPPAIRIRADQSVAYRHVSPVLSSVANAGCTDIVVASKTANSVEGSRL